MKINISSCMFYPRLMSHFTVQTVYHINLFIECEWIYVQSLLLKCYIFSTAK